MEEIFKMNIIRRTIISLICLLWLIGIVASAPKQERTRWNDNDDRR